MISLIFRLTSWLCLNCCDACSLSRAIPHMNSEMTCQPWLWSSDLVLHLSGKESHLWFSYEISEDSRNNFISTPRLRILGAQIDLLLVLQACQKKHSLIWRWKVPVTRTRCGSTHFHSCERWVEDWMDSKTQRYYFGGLQHLAQEFWDLPDVCDYFWLDFCSLNCVCSRNWRFCAEMPLACLSAGSATGWCIPSRR